MAMENTLLDLKLEANEKASQEEVVVAWLVESSKD